MKIPLFDLRVRVTQKITHLPLHRVMCAATMFEVATFNGLGGDVFARNATDGRQTDFGSMIKQ